MKKKGTKKGVRLIAIFIMDIILTLMLGPLMIYSGYIYSTQTALGWYWYIPTTIIGLYFSYIGIKGMQKNFKKIRRLRRLKEVREEKALE
ncbi:hypothetical protein [Alkalibacillus aidingensis]|uniref:hypothetical protein n=1 Tax=Alkalibacillus aidingensis TaxID=2747607 RepID=UPI001660436C|nr:hypothetical protein [Alkalibacillus aidingensis]